MNALGGWALALAGVLLLYRTVVVIPQVKDLRRRAALPEFQGTAHVVRLRHCLGEMSRLQARAGAAALALGALGIVLRVLSR